MNLLKIVSPILAAATLLGAATDGTAAQCRRIPSSGSEVYPTSGERRFLNMGCQDGTRANLIFDASPLQIRVKLVNKVTTNARVRGFGFNSIGGSTCLAESTAVGVEDSDNCDAGTTQFSGEIRND